MKKLEIINKFFISKILSIAIENEAAIEKNVKR
jgi:hypothetical protein